MADSLCGPSNALQNFQKHSTVDRTLQQDRLISRPSPSQGFRSSPGPNAGLLEPDFQAFQAGNLPLESQQGFQPQPFSHAAAPAQPGPAAWASDFQRMHISSPPPTFAQQSYNAQPQQRHDTGGWHQDFARQFGAEQRVMAQSSQMTGSQNWYSPMNGGLNMGMGMQPQFSGGMMGQQTEHSMVQQQQPAEAFDEEAFARAFEEAAKEAQMTDQEMVEASGWGVEENLTPELAKDAQRQDMEMGQDILLEESAERFMSDDSQIPNQARLGADLIHDPTSSPQSRPEHEDPDALARTAGQLLDSVRSNQTSKFQNSEFLELMRQLRDRQVTVKGDNIVGTVEGGDDERTKNELIYLFRALKRLVLDRDRRLASNTSEQVRSVLIILLQLNGLSSTGASASGSISYPRIQRTLQAVINSPDLSALQALRNLAHYTLLSFEAHEKAKTNTPASTLSKDSNAINMTNAEITSILPPTPTTLETLIYNYVSSLLQSPPLNQHQNQDSLERLLGYSFEYRFGNLLGPSDIHSPHIQRVREIMGTAVAECLDATGGVWWRLGLEEFFGLVAKHQLHGGINSAEFRKALGEVENGIVEGLKAGIKRAYEGYPYRFGIHVPGLERLREGEELSYDEQLEALEAQSRLRLMMARREQNGHVSREKKERIEKKEERRRAWEEGRHLKQMGKEE